MKLDERKINMTFCILFGCLALVSAAGLITGSPWQIIPLIADVIMMYTILTNIEDDAVEYGPAFDDGDRREILSALSSAHDRRIVMVDLNGGRHVVVQLDDDRTVMRACMICDGDCTDVTEEMIEITGADDGR